MAGIIDQKKPQRFTLAGLYVCKISIMVFDIPGAKNFVRIITAFKFGENILERLVEDVCLNIQASPMGHP